MKRKAKTKRYWVPAAAGLLALYVLTMGLATFLVKEQFVRDYRRQFQEAAADISREASGKEFSMEDTDWDPEARRDFYQSLAAGNHWTVANSAFETSVAFYDKDMTLMARSRDQIGHSFVNSSQTRKSLSFGLDDYLTWEEKEELAGFHQEYIRRSEDISQPEPFRYYIRLSPDRQELWGIYVQELTWTEKGDWDGQWQEDPLTGIRYTQESGVMVDYGTGEEISQGKEFYQTGSRIIWQWEQPDIPDWQLGQGEVLDTGLLLPYMGTYENGSFDRWKQWSTSPYLQDYPAREEFRWVDVTEELPLLVDEDGSVFRARYRLQIGMVGDPFSYAEIRMESRPWRDAMIYMKSAYIAGKLLTLACMFLLFLAFDRLQRQQDALEQRRRDFTNAIAHELKTPLAIIRNFAENLAEHNMEEKRDYYLAQIIGQTEAMDDLVVNMIEVSKLDSEELVLKKEPVALAELVRQQMAKLDPLVREKKLQVSLEEEGDFQVEGDRDYLARALWNLLANAVDHNIPGGRIRVRTEQGRCIIENTAEPLADEELLHAFDLLHTGNKSRSRKEGHMGMGLFLAERILKLHKIHLALTRTGDGVRAEIARKRD